MKTATLLVLLPAVALLVACAPDSPGKRIYFEGVGDAGPVGYTEGPDWLRFAGANCAVCHGNRGQGLSVQAGGVTGVAPPVTRAALAERGYDEAALRRALAKGVDPDGREFHYYMPRWELSEADMDALVDFLRGL
jgi:cytochrome c oxidase subunit II